MEKAILKTLIYSDIFDYPLNIFEIHKWLIGRKVTLRKVEKELEDLIKKRKINSKREYFFLKKRESLILKRLKREKESKGYIRKAKILCQVLKAVPFIKLVGISGGLAMENAKKEDDIDLFIITSKNKLWLTRLLSLSLLDFMGVRRKAGMKGSESSGKFCCNILVDEENLEQKRKDIYTAHEVLQMKVLWERSGIYQKYLLENSWVFKHLPNWVGGETSLRGVKRRSKLVKRRIASPFGLAMTMEKIAKWFQLKIMQKAKGLERIEKGSLYFHPNDIRAKVLNEYRKKVSKI